MPERRISNVTLNASRTTAGKKIDTWQVSLPDGSSGIDVMMHASRDEVHFSASGTHPCIKGLSWESTDMAELRMVVMDDIERAARRYFETDWAAAVMVEASLYKTDRDDALKVQLSLDMTDLHIDPSTPVGNRGETRVLKGRTATTEIQRSHTQTFETDNSLSQDNMRFVREEGRIATRAIVDGEMREEALALSRTMEAFSDALMTRLAPDMVRHAGLPAPVDLIEIMRAAVAASLEGPEEDVESFDP